MEIGLAEMMTADANVFIYLFDASAPIKKSVAEVVVDRLLAGSSAIGVQTIGEVQNVLRRKFKISPWDVAQRARNIAAAFDAFPASKDNAEEALGLMAAGHYSYWDALLLIAARDAGCTVMFTEDMHDGGTFGPLEIVNPFGASGPSDRAREVLSL